MKVDLSELDWKINNKSDPFGFKYGWRGVELQRHRLNSIFEPVYITLNTVKNAQPAHYHSEGL